MDPNVLLNAGIVAFLDERPADPISFLADFFDRATTGAGKVESAVEFVRRACAVSGARGSGAAGGVAGGEAAGAAGAARRLDRMEMYYEAFCLIADGEDGSALAADAMPSSAAAVRCAKVLQCFCTEHELPAEIRAVLRAELFPDLDARVTFEEFIAAMEVCTAVSDVDAAAEDAMCALQEQRAGGPSLPVDGATVAERLRAVADAGLGAAEAEAGSGGSAAAAAAAAVDRLSAALAASSAAGAGAAAKDFTATDSVVACAELDLLLCAMVRSAA